MTAADLVLADGSRVRAGDDLLWAVRGAGGNFGIVTALELDAYPVDEVIFSRMVFEADAALLEHWARLVERAPRELTSFLTVVAGRGDGPLAQAYTVYTGQDADAAKDALLPLLGAGRLLDQGAQLVPYHAVVAPQGGVHTGGAAPALRAGLLDHVTPAAAQALMGLLRSGVGPFLQLRSVGGAVNDLDPAATAYAHRHQNFSVNAVGSRLETLSARWDAEVAPHTDGLYFSFDTDTRPERLQDAFPGATLERLRRLKASYDPDNVFNQNFPIPPAEDGLALVAGDADRRPPRA